MLSLSCLTDIPLIVSQVNGEWRLSKTISFFFRFETRKFGSATYVILPKNHSEANLTQVSNTGLTKPYTLVTAGCFDFWESGRTLFL